MTLIVFAVVLSVAVAAPLSAPLDTGGAPGPEIRVLSQKFHRDQHGYLYGYKQSNGQIVKEVGRVRRGPEPGTGSLSQQGEFQFIGEDGQTYQLSYVADENGFQPQAAHLPQPPAQIPEYAQLRQEHPELFWAEASSL